MKRIYPHPGIMIQDMGQKFLSPEARIIQPKKWQGLNNKSPMLEVFDTVIRTRIPRYRGELKECVKPDLPWAEDHFQERVGGIPSNPGNTYMNWPYYKEDSYRTGGQFTHTYQERMWSSEKRGVRYYYGDLSDLIEHLWNNPDTRQAYLPIWFPEDTGVKHGGRVPCTLGYLFNVRDGFLHCSYFLRSCDYIRHFKNDVYMAGRLMQHILRELRKKPVDKMDFSKVRPGVLKIDIDSFHIFESDLYELKKRLNNP